MKSTSNFRLGLAPAVPFISAKVPSLKIFVTVVGAGVEQPLLIYLSGIFFVNGQK
jgi:hypothetical protein